MDNQNTQQPIPASQTPKIGSKGFLWTVGIIVVLAIISGGYLIWSSNQTALGGDRDVHGCVGSAGYSWCEVKNKCLRTWEESCSASSTVDLTGWQTYKNEQYGFEFKYPSVYVNIKSYPATLSASFSVYSSNTIKDCNWMGSSDEFAGCQLYSIIVQKNKIIMEGESLVKETITVDGITGEKIIDSSAVNQTYFLVQVKKGDLWYIQSFSISTNELQDGEKIFNQILSTFKFVDVQSSIVRDFEQALNQKDFNKVKNLLADNVNVGLEGSECCGEINRNEAWEYIKNVHYGAGGSGQYDFNQNSEIVKKIKEKGYPSGGYIVGVALDKRAIIFRVNLSNKVDFVALSENYDTFLW